MASSSTAGGAHRSFKGVVFQHNGHWGAQIYANHQRIWLGTFRSEHAAAMAYDSAAAKIFQNNNYSHHHRNFPENETTASEYDFQNTFSTEEVLAMIKDGSYQQKLSEFVVRSATTRCPCHVIMPTVRKGGHREEGYEMKEMFVKELTPSDVGKLNRLVIPKKHAVRHFPAVKSETEEVMVEFEDREGQKWVFRYCYWKSSQSYVFTKGWNKFVKEKGLRPKDVVGFYRRCVDEEPCVVVIDVVARFDDDLGINIGAERRRMGLELGLGIMERDINEMEEEEEVVSNEEEKEVMLFGVRIG